MYIYIYICTYYKADMDAYVDVPGLLRALAAFDPSEVVYTGVKL